MKLSKYCCGKCKFYTSSPITLDGLGKNYRICDNKKAKDSYGLEVYYGDSCDKWEKKDERD